MLMKNKMLITKRDLLRLVVCLLSFKPLRACRNRK